MMGKIAIGGLLETPDLVIIRLLGVKSGPGVAGSALTTLGRKGINVLCVVSSSDAGGKENMTLAVHKVDLDQALGLLQEVQEQTDYEKIEYQDNCSLIAVYGPHFSDRPSIAGEMFDALASASINIRAISTSVSTVSCVIDNDKLEEARNCIAQKFLIP